MKRLVKYLVLLITFGVFAMACGPASSPRPVSLEAEDCLSAIGDLATLYLFETSTPSCVAVGVHQRIDFFNKGFGGTVVNWFGDRALASDAFYTTDPVGENLEPGLYEVDGGPFSIPRILIIDPATSPLTSASITATSFDDVALGMTLDEASEALGLDIMIDTNQLLGQCKYGVVPGDPYSPVFGLDGQTISGISVFYPESIIVGSEVVCES